MSKREAIKRQKLYVFLDETSRLIKIGVSVEPEERRVVLERELKRPLNTLITIESKHAFRLEQSLHAHLTAHRVRGEWFRLTDAQINSLSPLCAGIEETIEKPAPSATEVITRPANGVNALCELEYKGYISHPRLDFEDGVVYGKIEYIRALVSYESDTAKGLKAAFGEAVDDYLETCEATGLTPEAPFKGAFNVRTSPDLHRRAAIYADQHGKRLNAVVNEALDVYLQEHAS